MSFLALMHFICPLTLMALRTIMMASCSDRSVSSVNCSAPPLRMMVHVFAFGQPLKKLYLQAHTQWVLAVTLSHTHSHTQNCKDVTLSRGQKRSEAALSPLSSNLDLFEEFTLTEDIVCHGTY